MKRPREVLILGFLVLHCLLSACDAQAGADAGGLHTYSSHARSLLLADDENNILTTPEQANTRRNLLQYQSEDEFLAFRSFDGPFLNPERQCGLMPTNGRFAIVFFSDKSPSNQLNMVLATKARRLREIGSTADIILAVPWDAQIYAQIDGIRIVTLEPPFMDDNVPLMSRVAIQSRKNCCGLREFYKLQVWAMTEYDKIILIDTDQALIRNFDRLFGCDVQFAFTSGTAHPLDAGMLLIKPDAIVRDYLVMSFLDAKSWSDETGWFGKGHVCAINRKGMPTDLSLRPLSAGCADGKWLSDSFESLPGLLWAFYSFKWPKDRWGALHPCVFNYQRAHLCEPMTMGKALIVHESGVMDDRPGGLITRPGSYAPLLIWKNGFMRQQENVKCHPSFFIVGPSASGAAALYYRLAHHPSVVKNKAFDNALGGPLLRARTGDTNAFLFARQSIVTSPEKTAQSIGKVNSFFSDGETPGATTVMGEYGSMYFMHPTIQMTMLRTCPRSSENFRFIVTLRDPMERLQAAYLQRIHEEFPPAGLPPTALGVKSGNVDQLQYRFTSIEEALRSDLKDLKARIASDGEYWWASGRPLFGEAWNNLLYEGLYISHLQRWQKFFAREQFLFVCSESLLDPDFVAMNDGVSKFLELPVKPQPASATPDPWMGLWDVQYLNDTQAMDKLAAILPKLSAAERERHILKRDSPLWNELAAFYAPYTRLLRNVFGVSCPWVRREWNEGDANFKGAWRGGEPSPPPPSRPPPPPPPPPPVQPSRKAQDITEMGALSAADKNKSFKERVDAMFSRSLAD